MKAIFTSIFLSNYHPCIVVMKKQYHRDKIRWKDMLMSIKQCDKISAIAGFLPLTIINFIKYIRPQTTVSELEDIKLACLVACSQRYDSYRVKNAIALDTKKQYNILNAVPQNVFIS